VDCSLNTVDTSLSNKQNLLDASTNLLGIGTSISALNYDNITLNKPTNFQSDWNTTIINKPDLSIYAIKSNVDSSLNTISTNLNTKENALTFSAPLTRTTNTISINLGSYSTTGTDPNFLKLSGGTMTGTITGTTINTTNLKVGTDGGRLKIATGATDFTIIGTSDGVSSATNTRIALSGGSRTGYNGNITYNATSTGSHIFSTTDTTIERLRIENGGNVGIGANPAVSKLDVRGTIYCQTAVIADITNIGATNNYQLRLTPPSTATQYSNIQSIYQATTITFPPLILNASGGNVGIAVNPSYKLHVTAGKTTASTAFAMKISGGTASDTGNHGTLLGLGTEDGAFSKCAIGHVRTGSYDQGDIVFLTRATADNANCTMSDEKMRITSVGNVSCTGSIGCVGVSASGGIRIGSNLGIQNSSPLSMLHLGNCTVTNSSPVLIFGKNTGSGFRNAFIGYNDSFYFCIGDYGNTNTSNSFTNQFGILYNAPASSFVIQSSGYCIMQYGYGTSSDERIKTNIKTIENALDKTLLLRGVEYNDIRIEPERKRIGLIAQEVELIIPEVVRTGDDGLKGIEYQNLVGLLIEAIKQLNNKVTKLENILKNNNLN
jgi:hypothetical protein